MFNLSYQYQIHDSASLTPQQLVRLYVETLVCRSLKRQSKLGINLPGWPCVDLRSSVKHLRN